MDFSLSSSLVGNAVSNPDKLALDLQFATDKTLTARKGPTPVFTRGSTGRFVGSNGLIQSAAINAPRFDHDPVTGVCRGLLMEESRTNLLQRSEEFGNAYWTTTRASITTDVATSPDGLVTSEKLITDTTAASNHRVDRSVITLALNTIYTLTVFAKASEYTGLSLGVGISAIEGVRFSLVGAGTATSVTSGYTGSIQQFPNEWYRCTCTFTSDPVTAVHRVALYVGQNGTTFTYTGDGTSGIFIWGAQMELGSFPTSYIPTTTASVVRSADVCSITGSAFSGFYNQPEGTLFADVTPQTVAQGAVVICVNTTSFENAHSIFKTDATISAPGRRWAGSTTVGPSAQTQLVTSTDVAISRSRLSYAYKLNDFAFAYAGGIVGTDNLGTIPSPTAMRIGSRDDGLSINGHLAAVRYYKKRLSNPRLQSITV